MRQFINGLVFLLLLTSGECGSPASRIPGSDSNDITSAVVTIATGDGVVLKSHACGFFISEDGLLVSARHLLQHAPFAAIHTKDGQDLPVEGVVADDPVHDVVLLKIKTKNRHYLHLGSFTSLKLGQDVRAMGDEYGFSGKITDGKIEEIERLADDYEWFSIGAIVKEGMSGSPVINDAGDVIGVLTGRFLAEPKGFVNSVDTIKKLLAKAGQKSFPVSQLQKRDCNELFDDPDFKAALKASDQKNPAEAVRRMRLAIGQFPQSPAIRVLLGSFYSAMKLWPEAEEAYLRAIDLRKDYATAWAYLAAVYGLEGKIRAGIAAGEKATQLQPDLPEGWSNLTTIYIAMHRFDDARRELEGLKNIPTARSQEMAAGLQRLLEIQEKAGTPLKNILPSKE